MSQTKDIPVPDVGDFDEVEIIEVLVSPGDTIAAEDSLITLESDKASMEIPSPEGGTVKEVKVKVGQKVKEGDTILTLEPAEEGDGGTAADEASGRDAKEQGEQTQAARAEDEREPANEAAPAEQKTEKAGKSDRDSAPAGEEPAEPSRADSRPRSSPTAHIEQEKHLKAHASPGVRRFGRELGVDLTQVQGSGRKGRVLKEDVKGYVKQTMEAPAAAGGGLGVSPMPEVDFSEFGEIETKPLTKINKLTGQNLHRNWVTVPHVTQFDKADITDLEAFRKDLNAENRDAGVKITLVSFLIKAMVSALREFPRFNSSLDPAGENLIFKKYFHVGVAVDTPDGLVVPVLRDVDHKSLNDLARELMDLSQKARDKKLGPKQMKGGCISISSLGGVGGTAFTPIVNAPEVAILGVSKASTEPVWNGKEFVPRLILPLSLSYDHRVIDGAEAARFTTHVGRLLSDTRRMLL